MPRETVRIETETDARPFYGERVWMHVDGERMRRTVGPHDVPCSGTSLTQGEYWDVICLVDRTNGYRQNLRGHEVEIEV